MKANEEMLYVELRQAEQEIMASLKQGKKEIWLKDTLEEELADIRSALRKVETGNFGRCEISGELFPSDLLLIMPTVRSKKDIQKMSLFYRKPIQ